MRFIKFFRKVYNTFFCVNMYLPLVIKELNELHGHTKEFIQKLKLIWGF